MSELRDTVREALAAARIGPDAIVSADGNCIYGPEGQRMLAALVALVNHAPGWLAALCDENEKLEARLEEFIRSTQDWIGAVGDKEVARINAKAQHAAAVEAAYREGFDTGKCQPVDAEVDAAWLASNARKQMEGQQ